MSVSANKETVNKEWLLVDAEGQSLGRVASTVAGLLRGKHKTNFTPHVDCGDNVVVINADKVALTGDKWNSKEYITYSGYPGGQRKTLAKDLMAKKPTAVLENAIKGMLPKNKVGRQMYRNLYVYVGTEHNQEAQQPKEYKL